MSWFKLLEVEPTKGKITKVISPINSFFVSWNSNISILKENSDFKKDLTVLWRSLYIFIFLAIDYHYI